MQILKKSCEMFNTSFLVSYSSGLFWGYHDQAALRAGVAFAFQILSLISFWLFG